jgi:hypothetical protein
VLHGVLLGDTYQALRTSVARLLQLNAMLPDLHPQTCGGRLPEQVSIDQYVGEGDRVDAEAPMSLG